MYKVLIVDDDAVVRLDLRTLIDWGSLNLLLLDDEINGKDALERIKTHPSIPDIVILDLFMPVMDGITLLKELKKIGYTGKVVVLSCHDEFESVKESLKAGAIDYLMKQTLEPEELIGVLGRAIEAIEEDREKNSEIYRLKHIESFSRQFLKRKFIDDLANGKLNDREILRSRLEEVGLKIDLGNVIFAIIEVDGLYRINESSLQQEKDNILFSVEKVVEEYSNEYFHSVFGDEVIGIFYAIFSFSMQSSSYFFIRSTVFETMSHIQTIIRRRLGITVSAGLSEICRDTVDFGGYFHQARKAVECKFFRGKDRIIQYSDIDRFSCDLPEKPSWYEKVLNELFIKDSKEFDRFFDGIYSRFANEFVSIEAVRRFNFNIAYFICKLLEENKISPSQVFACGCAPYEYANKIDTAEEVKEWLAKACVSASGLLRLGFASDDPGNEIRKAIDYIERNYQEDIKLEDISTYVNLSATYFSKLFKKRTGENFVEYLNRFRILKAKELIEGTDMKVYEIADKVGINNYRYFSKLFRVIEGLAPTDYKKKEKVNR